MTSKLNFLTQTSLNRKVKTKWFLLANIVLALGIIGVINVDSIITLFGGDFNEVQQVYVIDETDKSFELFKETLNVSASNLTGGSYDVKLYDKDIESAKEEIKKDNNIWLVVFEPDEDNYMKVNVVSNSFIDTLDYQLLSSSITSVKSSLAILDSNIDPALLESIYAPVNIERTILDESKKTEEESASMIMTLVFPIVILPFFMLTLFLVQMIGAEVNDEKATKSMEIIISNVSPKTHFFSKVLAGNLFVLLQGALLFIYSGIGLVVRNFVGGSSISNGMGDYIGSLWNTITTSSIGEQLIYIIPLTLVLMVLTFIAYSLLAGILASMTTNTEDFQQLQTPIMLISLAGYYFAVMASMFNGSLLIRIISYIPFISAILSPSLLVLGQIGVIDVIISIVLTIIVIYYLIKYGLRIYKVGILNYSSKDLWKKMFKAMGEK